MFDQLLGDLLHLLPEGQRVVDLYGGMGVIGCVVAPKCRSVVVVERDASAQEPFLEAKRRLPAEVDINYIVGDVGETLDVLNEATTVIVDPPRKGLPLPVVQKLGEKEQIRTLFYISCHFHTLERDAQLLLEKGFSITFARSYLFFPGTDQIETLVCFEKKGSG
jgi:tRNA/tmRNA/rRNA uracil-C5-methylase (TrmA/RlmC/RlmD family)